MAAFESAWDNYMERKFMSLVKELKENKCLSQDFEVLTKAEFAQKVLEAFDELGEP